MDPQNQSPPPSYPPPAAGNPKVKQLAIVMIVLGVLVAAGAFTKSWMSASERGASIGFGLTGAEACGRGQCMSISYGDMGSKVPADVKIFGWLGFLGGLAAAAGAVALGVFALTNKPNPIPPKVLNGVFGVAAAGMAGFLVRMLLEAEKGIGISYSPFLGLGGLIGVGVVAKMLEKERAGG